MKKIILLLPMLLLLSTGCNEKTGIIECGSKSKDVVNGYEIETNYKINYKGDIVESVETVETIISDSAELLDTLEETVNESYSKMNEAYGGYTYKVTNKDGKVVSEVSIDYNKMNVEQFVKDQPVLKSYVKNNKITVEGMKAIYESTGAVCK